ncbi:acyl-CoA synthetase family member 2, mitochondrial-like [Mizuhopecten yessoensis]|nr:acyl-CoA synthetase family member 2, mitochondrial-like [Mizuhopecten yessoensis]
MSALSYLHHPPTVPRQYVTINDLIKKNAALVPNTEAFVYRPVHGPRQSITYADLYDRARGVAQFLLASGVQRQDRVGLFGPNTLSRVVAEFGILLSGAVVLQLNIEFKNASDAVDILDKSDCHVLFTDPGINDSLLPIVESLETADENVQQRRKYIFLRESNSSKLVFTVIDDIPKQADVRTVLPEVYPEDDALVFTTSGSTGKPKMAVHGHFSLTSALGARKVNTCQRSILYNDRPFCWIGGTVMMASLLGNTHIFTDSTLGTTGRGIKKIWTILKEESVTYAFILPYCIRDLITEKDSIPDDGYRLERITTSGQIIDNFFTQVVGRFCKKLIIGYGSSEAGGMAFSELNEGDVLETGRVGPPVPGVEVRIVDEDGCPVTTGQQGNIQVRSTFLMKRYHADTTMTDAVFTSDRPPWLKTGDVGLLTSSGDIIVRGRMTENISRGGRKILPNAVDDVLKKVVGINQVATVAVPDTRMYEEACVCYVASDLTPKHVQSYCENHYVDKDSLDGMGYMPKYFLRFDEFPFLHTGKTDKVKLKNEAARRLKLVEQ